jgi:hypothetical protein
MLTRESIVNVSDNLKNKYNQLNILPSVNENINVYNSLKTLKCVDPSSNIIKAFNSDAYCQLRENLYNESEKTYSLTIRSDSNDFESEYKEENFKIFKSKTSSMLSDTYWMDPDFYPSKKSLFMNGSKIKRMNLTHSNGFKQVKKWLRPFEIRYPSEENYLNVSIFLDPSPKDVIQGELGNGLEYVFIFSKKICFN